MTLAIIMHILLLLIGAGAFAMGIFGIFNHSRILRKFYYKMSEQHDYKPSVTVLAPVRSMDEKFEENIKSLLAQDYPNKKWEVLFIVDPDDTNTEKKVMDIVKKSKSKNTRIITSITLETCSGKNAAMIAGLKHAKYDVIAGYDSDALVKKDWLSSLVGPLEDKTMGTTTGFRFYMPTQGFASYVLSAWNSIGLISMRDPYTFVWGGSFAIKKNLIKKLGIDKEWLQTVSDDTVITRAIRKANLHIYFVPSCIVLSYLGKYFNIAEFTTRQTTLIRWYWPKVYRFALFLFMFSRLSTILGLITLYLYITTKSPIFALESFLLLWPIVFGLLRASLDFRYFRVLLSDYIGSRSAWVFADFFAQWLMTYNLIAARFKKTITWRGRAYDLSKETYKA